MSECDSSTDVHLHGFSYLNHHLDECGSEWNSECVSECESEEYTCYSLPDQVAHAAAAIRSIISTHTTTHSHTHSVTFITHSLGAYVALELFSDEYSKDITSLTTNCVLLMPLISLTHTHTLTHILFTCLSYCRNAVRKIAKLLVWCSKKIPLAVREYILTTSLSEHTSEYITRTVMGMCTHRLIQNVLSVCESEVDLVPSSEDRLTALLHYLTSEEDLTTINTTTDTTNTHVHSGRCRVMALYTNSDPFAPLAECERLFTTLSHVHTRYIPHLTHGFSTLQHSCIQVTDAICEFLSSDVVSQRGLLISSNASEGVSDGVSEGVSEGVRVRVCVRDKELAMCVQQMKWDVVSSRCIVAGMLSGGVGVVWWLMRE